MAHLDVIECDRCGHKSEASEERKVTWMAIRIIASNKTVQGYKMDSECGLTNTDLCPRCATEFRSVFKEYLKKFRES